MLKSKKTILIFLILVIGLSACGAQSTTEVSPTNAEKSVETEAEPTPVLAQETTPDTETTSTFTLTSPDLPLGGYLPVEYTCDGDGSTLALSWSGAPFGTVGYAVIMHHIPNAEESAHWYWVLYNIPTNVLSLPKNVTGVGTLGNNINNGLAEYSPPCSKGPGDKEYIYTVYALSAEPHLTVPTAQIDRDALLAAIQDITLTSSELHVVYARSGMTDDSQQTQQAVEAKLPPPEAYAACTDKALGDSCNFTAAKGPESGTCESVQDQITCVAPHGPNGQNGQQSQQGGQQPTNGAPVYNIEQAISDRAQGMTIAYDALAFLTGDLGSDSFFPPGKVADFWGLQYLRDNDPSEMGHAGDFLTSAAMNTFYNLTPDQRAELVALAESQVDSINEYGYMRFTLIDAFNRLLEGDLPTGATELNEEAVKAYSAELYRLDGEISFDRAELMGNILNNLSAEQKAYFDAMVGKGMLEWADVEEPADMRSLDRDVKVAVMTYAADMFSWYAGSVEADVYFCPERHGTYFGSFYLKDIHAMSDSSYAIPTDLTGNMGEAMFETLAHDQSQLITDLVDVQKPSLQGIVDVREQISIELRKFLDGEAADKALIISLMEEYGTLDGAIIYNYATNFSQVNQSLTDEQQAQLMAYREEMLGDLMYPSGAYLYSQAISMPAILNTDFLFK